MQIKILLYLLNISIALGYIIFGKKSLRYIFLLTGFALCIFPFLIEDIIIGIIFSIGLYIYPFVATVYYELNEGRKTIKNCRINMNNLKKKLKGYDNYYYYDLKKIKGVDKLPYSKKILLENLLRNLDGNIVKEEDINDFLKQSSKNEIAYYPSRVILQDFTGVPALVDLAAMRSALLRKGDDPKKINPNIPVDLVIDHSVQVDYYGTDEALVLNTNKEFERNKERYEFLKWGQKNFDNFSVVPPATGIVHQVNLEFLGKVVTKQEKEEETIVFPDTLVGTDSHTTMINGLGILGWGVGGIEAEAAMLKQPIFMLNPEVVGVKLTGIVNEGITATDLVLTITENLRDLKVVGKFVEFYGDGLDHLTLADRATISNMCPEYGATVGFFPIDDETLNYLRVTGRDEEQVKLVERYSKEVGLFRSKKSKDPEYDEIVEIDLSEIKACVAGPKRPQDRIVLEDLKESFEVFGKTLKNNLDVENNDKELKDGSIVIAAITSCTNTSNPGVMIAAGLLAKKAVEKGLKVPEFVKTSLAPGSKVVTEYLKNANLLKYLEKIGFNVVGYGCTTCIGNSGPLKDEYEEKIEKENLLVASVLSGNRNFEGRIHPKVKGNYLASPALVIAYALTGKININIKEEVIGYDLERNPVYLKELWPSSEEIKSIINEVISANLFNSKYKNVYDENEQWNNIEIKGEEVYEWDEKSTYIHEPPFFMEKTNGKIINIDKGRVIVKVKDSITTDHISPAGFIGEDSPAGKFLIERGIEKLNFNSYGSRRGNDKIMLRGTFGNVRLKNQLAPGTEGGWTNYLPDDEISTIYDASLKYKQSNTPLFILAGKEYGTGSSRDWAAKGVKLLGVKVVIAESYERIHRSNLLGMGVLPLEFLVGESIESLGLDGTEVFSTSNFDNTVYPKKRIEIIAIKKDGTEVKFKTICRLDTNIEIDYYKSGGILNYVLENI